MSISEERSLKEINDRALRIESRLVEVNDRAVRIESRLVQLGDYVGANLRSTQRIIIDRTAEGMLFAEIDALDVSVSRILKEVKAKAPGAAGNVGVWCKGNLVAMVFV